VFLLTDSRRNAKDVRNCSKHPYRNMCEWEVVGVRWSPVVGFSIGVVGTFTVFAVSSYIVD